MLEATLFKWLLVFRAEPGNFVMRQVLYQGVIKKKLATKINKQEAFMQNSHIVYPSFYSQDGVGLVQRILYNNPFVIFTLLTKGVI